MNGTAANSVCSSKPLPLAMSIFLGLLFLASMILNGASLWIFRHMKHWSPSTLLQFNLALIDVLLLPTAPLMLVYYVHLGTSWPLGRFSCCLLIFLLSIHLFGSTAFLLLISVHRYWSVARYNSRTPWGRKSFLKKVCVAVWLAIGIQCLLPFLFLLWASPSQGPPQCLNIHETGPTPFYFYYNLVAVGLGLLLPLGMALACYVCLVTSLSSLTVPSSRSRAMKAKTNQMITVTLLSFTLCFVPVHVCRTVATSAKFFGLSCSFLIRVELAYYITWIFTVANSCLNPLLYSFANENFNKIFFRVLLGYHWFPGRDGARERPLDSRNLQDPVVQTSASR
ncbi:P2Y purinoceptor 2-like [Ornithorhynchus anatinus]|uniref:P2Y purinoceptor 2-like n=1 Tax=Ornithorhynchus anatinus TaxID=9258 RepID=UPI0004548148|nr:P2Y purinoceptor 2-like [Ornithorhynchus anatinus]